MGDGNALPPIGSEWVDMESGAELRVVGHRTKVELEVLGAPDEMHRMKWSDDFGEDARSRFRPRGAESAAYLKLRRQVADVCMRCTDGMTSGLDVASAVINLVREADKAVPNG